MTPKQIVQDRFRLLFEHSSDAHFIMTENAITDCNEAAVRLLKASSKEQVLSRHPARLSPEYQPDGALSAEKASRMDAFARQNGFHRFEWYHQKMDGEVFPVEVTLNAVELEGRPGLIAVWHDLTELKLKEEGLRRVNEKMKRDLSAASAIQRSLLPVSSPLFKGVRASWIFEPSDELGGDMLNIFTLDEKHLGLYVLDVTGHGIAASLLSVTASQFLSPSSEASFVRNSNPQAQFSFASPSEVAFKLNRHFSSNPNEAQMLTFVYGILNTETFDFSYVCAGHPYPLIISSAGELRVLGEAGMPIGVMRDAHYEESRLKLQSGDRLYFYSDGVTEAKSKERELFGRERLIDLIKMTNKEFLSASIDALAAEIEIWCNPHAPADDITILACELTCPGGRC